MQVATEDEYDEESFPYAHLFKGGWGGSDASPLERYRHAIKDARDTGSVPLIVCFDEPFPLTPDLSPEEEQRYKEAVSEAQDRIANSIRKGNVGLVKKFIYTACVSINLDHTGLQELLSLSGDLGITSVSEQVGIPLPGGVSMRMDAVGETGSVA